MKTLVKINLLLVLVLLLAACQPAATPVPEPTVAPEPTMAIEAPIAIEPTVAPAPSFDLAGTAWVLTSLNGAPALEGATVTLQFGADGTAYGTDGCNRYSTTFTEDGASLTFAPAAGTMMMCREPPGVMEQATAFAAALAAVRKWGGVLEHPAATNAWAAHDLTAPVTMGWQRVMCGGWVCEVWQSAYGHRANKATWLYYHGTRPPMELRWARIVGTHKVGHPDQRGKSRNKPTLPKREASATPEPFRDALLALSLQANVRSDLSAPGASKVAK
jgi:heat shock protein HslJ